MNYSFNCSRCGYAWEDEQEGSHNDKCPECNAETSPSWVYDDDAENWVSLMNDEQEAHFMIINYGDLEPTYTKMPNFDCVLAAMKRHRRDEDRSCKDGLYYLHINWEERKIEELTHYGLDDDRKCEWDDEKQKIGSWFLDEVHYQSKDKTEIWKIINNFPIDHHEKRTMDERYKNLSLGDMFIKYVSGLSYMGNEPTQEGFCDFINLTQCGYEAFMPTQWQGELPPMRNHSMNEVNRKSFPHQTLPTDD